MPNQKDFADEIVDGIGGLAGWGIKKGINAAKQANLNRRENELFRNDGVTSQNRMRFPERWRF